MRSTPSFFGEFHKKKLKSSSSRPPAELQIEKEANLREKRKQILQRLKQKSDQENVIEEDLPLRQMPVQIDGISEKVIFSPRTAKRFQQASQRHEITNSNDITGTNDGQIPTIILQESLENHAASGDERLSKSEGKTITKEELESIRQKYVPSFTEKPPLRKLQDCSSPILSQRAKTSPRLLANNSELEGQRRAERDGRISNSQTPGTERKVYLDKFNSQKPPLVSSNSLEVSDDNVVFVESSPLRRSASFHSLKDRYQSRMLTGRKEFLNADDSSFGKTSSLPSVRLQSSSLTSLLPADNLEYSSTSGLKLHQDKLEQDFHRLEKDLDRAFSELRKYLKTAG